jgi:hypothetical protein
VLRVCATQGYGFAFTLGFILSPTTWADSAAKMEWKIIFSKIIKAGLSSRGRYATGKTVVAFIFQRPSSG